MNGHGVLTIGNVILAMGIMARTYSYRNPEKHCVQIDYINVWGCFGSAATPTLLVWGATVIGLALVVHSLLRGRRGA